MANSMERSEAAGARWFAGDYSPEMLMQAVAAVEDGRVDLLQDTKPHHVKKVRKED